MFNFDVFKINKMEDYSNSLSINITSASEAKPDYCLLMSYGY